MTPHRLFSCVRPSSRPLVLGVAHVVALAVALVVVLAETQSHVTGASG